MPDRSLNKEKGGIRKTTKKPKATTAFLIGLMIIAFIIPFFIWIKASSASPLGKVIEVCILCDETGQPVPDGFAVTLTNGFSWTGYTVDGCVEFGSGLEDGWYTISFWWNGAYTFEREITCDQIVWHFDFGVPNPTITKHFEYADIGGAIEGLNVKLIHHTPTLDAVVAQDLTDATGTVKFGGDIVEVSKEYYLEYTWGSLVYREPDPTYIHFAYDANGDLLVCAWEQTNYLEPKSGGGKQSVLG